MLCKLTVDQWCKRGIGVELRWIRSRGDAGERMGRNGAAPGMWWRARNTASATCTVEEIVQESLWKSPLSPPPPAMVVVAEEPSKLTKEWLLAPPVLVFTSIQGILAHQVPTSLNQLRAFYLLRTLLL